MHNFFEGEYKLEHEGVSPEDNPEKDPVRFIENIHFRDGEVSLSEKFPREVLELVQGDRIVWKLLAKILEKRGEADIKHAVRMAGMVISTAEKMDFTPEDRKLLIRSALVHDVGKIGIPSEILNKPSKLSEAETDTVHEHVRIGWKLIKELGDDELAEIVIRHHEIKGYPRSGEDRRNIGRENKEERRITKPKYERLARLLSVLDVFDSLGSRPYNENKTAHEILSERKRELKDLDSQEEKNLVALLEGREIDPKYVVQKEVEKTPQEFTAYTAS